MERFVKEGEQLIRQMQSRGVQMQADQLPISAIVRAPLLAIRWQLSNHKVIAESVRYQTDLTTAVDSSYPSQIQVGKRLRYGIQSPSSSRPSHERTWLQLKPITRDSLKPVRPAKYEGCHAF